MPPRLPSGVLIIHSNQRPTPAAIVIEDTLRKVVPEGLERPVEIYSEYLDIERFSAEDSAARKRSFCARSTAGATSASSSLRRLRRFSS